MTKIKKLFPAAAILSLIAAFGITQLYIWGNAYITEFQADCTDTLLWANASLESGTLFKPTFDYAYRLAFGGQWLFMPFIGLFGVGMTALRYGMCLFTVLFTIALYTFFRALNCTKSAAVFETGVMLLAVCATKKTREIFFGHIIHYSLSVFYLLLAFIFLGLYLKNGSKTRQTVGLFLLLLCLFMCSANGTVQMLYVTLPLAAGCLLEAFLSENKKLLPVVLIAGIAAAGGFLFSKSFNTNYSDSYSVIMPAEDWAENLLNFPKRWISLFYQLPERKLDAFSPVWIKTVFRTIFALLTLVGFCLSVKKYKNIGNTEPRVFIFTAWMMFAAFLFFFVFGKISDVDWRLTPLLFAAEVVVLLLFNHQTVAGMERTLSGGLTLLCGLALVINAFSNGFSVLRIPYDAKIWYAENGLMETLKAHDLNYGYISSYWLSNSVTVLSDDTVRVRYVGFENGEPYLLPFNSDMEWYDDQPEQDRYFLAVKESQFDPEMPLTREASEVLWCYQEDTRNTIKENYAILVLDRNIMKSEYDRLIERYR